MYARKRTMNDESKMFHVYTMGQSAVRENNSKVIHVCDINYVRVISFSGCRISFKLTFPSVFLGSGVLL